MWYIISWDTIPHSAVGSSYYNHYKCILPFTLVHSGRSAWQATHPAFSLPSCPRFNNGSGNRILGNRNIWCIVSSSGLPLWWERPPGVFLIYRRHPLALVFTLPSCSAPSGISHLLKMAPSYPLEGILVKPHCSPWFGDTKQSILHSLWRVLYQCPVVITVDVSLLAMVPSLPPSPPLRDAIFPRRSAAAKDFHWSLLMLLTQPFTSP